jgi:hypothetical protein
MISIDQGVSGVTSLAFDTSPFIYLLERSPKYLACVRDIFGRVDRGEVAGCTSVITVTEVLTLPTRRQNAELQREYRQLLTGSRDLRLLPITAEVADQAATFGPSTVSALPTHCKSPPPPIKGAKPLSAMTGILSAFRSFAF